MTKMKKMLFNETMLVILIFLGLTMFAIAANATPVNADITTTEVATSENPGNGEDATAWPPKNFGAYGNKGLTGKKLAIHFAKANKTRLAKNHRNFSKKHHRGITGGVIKKSLKKIFGNRHNFRACPKF